MVIIWEWIKNLKLRNKLALLYTVVFTLVLGVTFLFIYSISEKNRREEFFKRLSDRTITTFKISVQVDQIDNSLLRIFDQNTINSLSDEKILLFDSSFRLVYSNIDSEDISYATQVLKKLKSEEGRVEKSEDNSELLGLKFENKGHTYYGISKAYDRFGESKIRFLAILLTGTFIMVTMLIVFLSFFLSNIITKPITRLTQNVEKISPDELSNRVQLIFANDEIGFLGNKFNELLDKVENAFRFQFHYIHHLSHELKTPLAIMMANAERALAEDDADKLNTSMQFQRNAIMELSHIINAMLDISKMEKNLAVVSAELIRIDEMIFECIDEITFLNEKVRFDFRMNEALDERNLTISGNSRMIKMVILNLIKNAVNFSEIENPEIEIFATNKNLLIKILNDGHVLDSEEQVKLFKHSFRGKNSLTVKGFGLGLVLAYRIVNIHNGNLEYSVVEGNRNCFILSLPTALL
jgi:signal transduction histidine kinase